MRCDIKVNLSSGSDLMDCLLILAITLWYVGLESWMVIVKPKNASGVQECHALGGLLLDFEVMLS